MAAHPTTLAAASACLPGWLGDAASGIDVSNVPTWAPNAVAFAGALLGLVLLVAGGRFLRPVVIFGSAIAGGAIVWSAATADASPHPWMWTIGGFLLGAFLGLILFRLAAAAALGVTLAIGVTALLAFGGVVHALPATDRAPLTAEQLFLADVPIAGADSETPPDAASPTQSDVEEALDAALRRARAFASALANEGEAMWNDLESRDRAILMGAATIAGSAGLVIGFFFPMGASCMLAAGAGASIFVPSVVWLVRTFNAPLSDKLPQSPGVWLVIAAAVGVMGFFIQVAPRPSRKHRHPRRSARSCGYGGNSAYGDGGGGDGGGGGGDGGGGGGS